MQVAFSIQYENQFSKQIANYIWARVQATKLINETLATSIRIKNGSLHVYTWLICFIDAQEL